MAHPLRITSSSNPRVKQLVRLREQRQRRRSGLFVAEGQRELTRALAAGLRVLEVYRCPSLLTRGGLAGGELEQALARLSGEVVEAELSEAVFRKAAYLREPEGVLAVVEQPRWSWDNLPGVAADGGVTGAGAAAKEGPLCLVAVGIEKPGNLGAMVRTADAAGCAAVVAAAGVVDAFNPNAIRTSTAAVFTMPVIAADETEAIERLRERGYRVFASTLERGSPHTQVDLRGPTAIVIGAEDIGLGEAWLEAADRTGGGRVHIPMQGRTVDSLNASTAAAVLLFEARRQREA